MEIGGIKMLTEVKKEKPPRRLTKRRIQKIEAAIGWNALEDDPDPEEVIKEMFGGNRRAYYWAMARHLQVPLN